MNTYVKTAMVLVLNAALASAGAQAASPQIPAQSVNKPSPMVAQPTAQNTGTASPLPFNRATTLPSAGTDDLNKSVGALQQTLTELQALQLQTKQAHWNVSGTLWYTMHELLQDHYDGLTRYVDEVAERQLSVGASSDGRAITIVAASRLPEIPGGFLDDTQVIQFFTLQYQTVAQRIFQRIGTVEKVDPTTVNLLQEVEHAVEKYQWQMRAFLQQTPRDPNTGFDLNNGKPVPLPGK